MEWIAIGDAAHEPPVKAYFGCQPEKSYFRDHCLDYICKKALTIFRMSLWVLVDDILGISKPAFSMGAITSALKSRYTAGYAI